MTTYLQLKDTPPDHLLMWDAFRAGRTAVEALHGPSRLEKTGTPESQLPIKLGRMYRMSAIWFLPSEAGTLLNNGFHLDFDGFWTVSVWTPETGRVEVKAKTVRPQIVLGALTLAELIPSPAVCHCTEPPVVWKA